MRIVIKKEVNEFATKQLSHTQRIIRSAIPELILYLILFLVIGVAHLFLSAFFVTAFLIAILWIQSYRHTKIYVTHIVNNKSTLLLEYMDGDRLKEIKGSINSFSFSKGKVWYMVRGTLLFLVIKFENVGVLRQYAIGDFNEVVFNYILDAFGAKEAKARNAPPETLNSQFCLKLYPQ